MEILIFAGFLGSGKTTVINRLLRGISERGQTAAIIENEIGDVGIDDVFFEGTGMSVTPLFGGCVCCQITGSLIEAAQRIEDEIKPDWLVVEMTGLALMSNIRQLFAKYGRDGIVVHTISVLDISRWEILNKALYSILVNQLTDADIILMNKTDISPVTPEIEEKIAEISRGALTLELVATQENTELWSKLEALLKIGGQK